MGQRESLLSPERGGKGSLRGRSKKGKGPAKYQKRASATPPAPSPGASDLPLRDPAWIQQLVKSLIPLIRAELQPQAPPEVEPEAADSPGPDPHAEPYFSPMEYMASEADLSVGAGDEGGDSRRGWPEGEPEFPGECSHGTDISREALREVTGLLRAKFGFPEPPQQPASPVSRMALKAGLEPGPSRPPPVPVDYECEKRLAALAAAKSWTPFPRVQNALVEVPEEDQQKLFRPPPIPEEAMDRLRSHQGIASGALFKDPAVRKQEALLRDLDLAARTGLKFSALLLLLVEYVTIFIGDQGTATDQSDALQVCGVGPGVIHSPVAVRGREGEDGRSAATGPRLVRGPVPSAARGGSSPD